MPICHAFDPVTFSMAGSAFSTALLPSSSFSPLASFPAAPTPPAKVSARSPASTVSFHLGLRTVPPGFVTPVGLPAPKVGMSGAISVKKRPAPASPVASARFFARSAGDSASFAALRATRIFSARTSCGHISSDPARFRATERVCLPGLTPFHGEGAFSKSFFLASCHAAREVSPTSSARDLTVGNCLRMFFRASFWYAREYGTPTDPLTSSLNSWLTRLFWSLMVHSRCARFVDSGTFAICRAI